MQNVTLYPKKKCGKSIVFMNFKGGVTKTTSCEAVAHELYERGYSVLLIDGDPQANLTRRCGVSLKTVMENERTVAQFYYKLKYDFSEKTATIPYIIKCENDTHSPVMALLCGEVDSQAQAIAAKSVISSTGMINAYKKWIEFYSNYFDYILIDTAPSITDYTINEIIISIVENVVIPFDGIDAATGTGYLLKYISSTLENNFINEKPNVFLLMSKYGKNSKDIEYMLTNDELSNVSKNKRFKLVKPDRRESRMFIYRLYKTLIPEYICNNGIPELRTIRDHPYTSLKTNCLARKSYCNVTDELIQKMRSPPEKSLVDVWFPGSEVNKKIIGYMESVDKYIRQYTKNERFDVMDIRFNGYNNIINYVNRNRSK